MLYDNTDTLSIEQALDAYIYEGAEGDYLFEENDLEDDEED